MNLLITAVQAAPAAAMAERLRVGGLRLAGHCACATLVRDAVRTAPEVVVLVGEPVDAQALAALRLLAEALPLPVVVLAPPEAIDADELLAAGIHGWLPAAVDAPTLAAAARLARAHFEHERQQSRALADAQARLDERKWVERAKGVLMRHQQLSEESAFLMLRNASMQANLRVGEVSRGLVETAQAAEAVNRAGQLRMLSQRWVKALAQRQAGVDRAGATALLAQTDQRLQDNLDRLAQWVPAPLAGALQQAQAAWSALRLLDGSVSLVGTGGADTQALAEADGRAETLLLAAEQLTESLDQAGGRRSLRVVNLCGRQRMLVQRLAKQALLAGQLAPAEAGRQAALAVATLTELEAGLAALEQAPLTNADIRQALAQARGQWLRMRQGVQRPAGVAAMSDPGATLARESEALSASFDTLTSLYEHSLQVLLG